MIWCYNTIVDAAEIPMDIMSHHVYYDQDVYLELCCLFIHLQGLQWSRAVLIGPSKVKLAMRSYGSMNAVDMECDKASIVLKHET